ncbi:MAG: carbon-nitrogen hydrolase [Nitrospinae bacterium]|nr:carbon-nitrogen hydrolase [Nitrospinota bacterium]
MEKRKYRIGLVQMAMSADPAANLAKSVAKIAEACALGAEVVCLPELFRTHYFCQREDAALFNLAEPVPGPTSQAVAKAAADCGAAVIASLFERRAAGVYHNTAAVFGPDGKTIGLYRKTHIPDDPCFYEKYYFTPGDLGFKAFNTGPGRIGVLVCWDQWYPEAARLTAMEGAEVIFYPTAIGWHPAEKEKYGVAQREAWMAVQRGHAIANGVFVAAVNRIGFEKPEGSGDGLEFWGSSFVYDPFGRLIAQGSVDKEEIVIAEVDASVIEDTRRNWPFFRDRRIDIYGGITKRFGGE